MAAVERPEVVDRRGLLRPCSVEVGEPVQGVVARRRVADPEKAPPDIDVEGDRGGDEGDGRDGRKPPPCRRREDRPPGCKPPPGEKEGPGAQQDPGVEVELEDGVEPAVVPPEHLLEVEDLAEGEHRESGDAEEARE